MKAIERVKQYIDFKGLNNSSFEKKIELSNGYIGTQMKRKADLGEGVLIKILDNCLDINPEWLLTGKGEMLKNAKKLDPKAESINTDYKELADARKEIIEYKDKEIKQLNKIIDELKKAKEPVFYSGMVAEPSEKLSKK
jgi:hypothetical protein